MANKTTEQLNNEKREHEKQLNRERVARYRERKKAENATQTPSSYDGLISRLNGLVSQYSEQVGVDGIYSAFARAGMNFSNQPQIQNSRVKAISSLPTEYTKEQLGEFLRNPYDCEQQLRQTSEILRWTAYPYAKIIKTYQDIPTYRYYSKPLYVEQTQIKSKEFWREARLIDKINKELRPEAEAHKITGQALTQGKVFYYPRYAVDKVHNQVRYFFMQQLPEDWTLPIGFNSVSGTTVSFNMMYFLQIGTDVRQFGNLFMPYLDDFNDMFVEPKQKKSAGTFVYASVGGEKRKINFYPSNVKKNAVGNPKVFEQNGRWFYWVSLPIDKIWTFSIDDTTQAVASPLSGLLMTYGQQADYEAAQLSLLLNPLIKIFTGEIPYFASQGSTDEDGFRLSLGGRALFEGFFNALMATTNTSGTALYTAPVENIKSHDYPESANANKVASSFNEYATEKSGLAAIIPISDPKAGQANLSAQLESRYSECIYRQFERMMNHIYEALNLNYDWEFNFFGTIYTEEAIRKNALSAIANGDISAHFILAALDNQSIMDKLTMMYVVKESGMLDMLIPPITSYTMKQDVNGGLPPQAGRPKSEDVTEGNEKSIDSGEGSNE